MASKAAGMRRQFEYRDLDRENPDQSERGRESAGRRGRAGRQGSRQQQQNPSKYQNSTQNDQGDGWSRGMKGETMRGQMLFESEQADRYGDQETNDGYGGGDGHRRDQSKSGHQSLRNQQANQYREMDESMDLQLHPLRDSTWAEIFPVLSIFEAICSGGEETPRGSRRGGSLDVPGGDRHHNDELEMANFRSHRTEASSRDRSPGAPRTCLERIAEFNDPQRALGAGISSYHQQLVHLFFLFLALMLMHLVNINTFKSYSFYSGSLAKTYLGNMGFSQTECLIESMQKASSEDESDAMSLKCASGARIGQVVDFGITTMFEDQQACSRKETTQYCDQFFHDENFRDFFANECRDKRHCALAQVHKFLDVAVDRSRIEICMSGQSRFYLQYECREPTELTDQKRTHSLPLAIVEAGTVFLVIAVLIFNSVKTVKMGQQYDELNLTASDYTLYLNLLPKHVSEFEEMYARQLGQEQPQHPRGLLFKRYIEAKLKIQGANIARIDLVFDNAKMINLLEARGNAIKTEKFSAIQDVEAQIEAQKQYQYNADVVGAFVTYEKNSDIRKIQAVFGGTDKGSGSNQPVPPFQVERPVDPSNVKWKNMQIRSTERSVRGFLVCLVLAGLLYVSFLVQVLVSNWRFENQRFERIDCGFYRSLNNKSIFQNKAYAAWSEHHGSGEWAQANQDSGLDLEEAGQRPDAGSFINGTLSCFCESERSKEGWSKAVFGTYGFNSRHSSEFDSDSTSQGLANQEPQQICKQYLLSETVKNNYAIISSFLIFLTNLAFIRIAEPLASLVGTNFATQERVLVSLTIFMCLVLDTCVMPILLQANFSADWQDSFWDLTFSEGGRNSDFGARWYPDIGPQLTLSLIILSFQPIFSVIGELISLKFTRYLQRNHWYAGQNNNHLDNIKFLELHAGPEYQFQLKTAPLNAVLFITMALGMAFPIFYPIALFAITIQYIVERYTLAMFYRLPPKFSLDLTEQNGRILSFGPLFGTVLGFWMLGNKQMFSNEEIEPIVRITDVPPSHHTVGRTFLRIFKLELSVEEAILLVSFLLLVIYFVLLTLSTFLDRVKVCLFGKQLEYQKTKIPDYFWALREQDLEELIEEEQTFCCDFNVHNMSERTLRTAEDMLRQGQSGAAYRTKEWEMRKTITGEPYYQVYKNFDYWLKFNNQNSQEEKNVKLLLCLPLIPPHFHDQITLSSGGRSRRGGSRRQTASPTAPRQAQTYHSPRADQYRSPQGLM